MKPRWTTRALAAGRIQLCEGCGAAYTPTWISPFFCRPCDRTMPPGKAFSLRLDRFMQLPPTGHPSFRLPRTFFSQLP